MSDEAARMKQEVELALLRRALLSSIAATNVLFEGLLALSKSDVADWPSQVVDVIARGTVQVDEALVFIKEAQDVRVGS